MLYFLSAHVQFAASLIFLCALNLIKGRLTRRIKSHIFSYIGFFALCPSVQLINEQPENLAMLYLFGDPATLSNAAIVWKLSASLRETLQAGAF